MKIPEPGLDPLRPIGRFELMIAALVVGALLILKYAETAAGPWAMWPRIVSDISAVFCAVFLLGFAFRKWRRRRGHPSAD